MIPMVDGFLPVHPRVVEVDNLVPGMAVAIGAVRGSVMGQAQNRAVGKSGDPVEGIPRRGKETRATDTDRNTLLHCRG